MSTSNEGITESTLVIPESLHGSAASAFESHLATLLRGRPDEVVIDCADLEMVTSSHIALLWNARCECASAGAHLRLESPSPSLKRILQVLDLDSVFNCNMASGSATLPTEETSPAVEQPAVYRDEFSPTPEGIDAGIIRLMEFLSRLNAPELALFELRIVVYEVATNIMCHSTLSPMDRVGVDVRADAHGVTMEISDPGTSFDPTAHPACTDYREAGRNHQSRGFGLAMIRGLVDSMQYTRRDSGINVLTVKKRWSTDS